LYLASRFLAPVPEVVRPTSPLEPPVAALIAAKIAAADAAPGNAERRADLALAYEANGLWPEALACFEHAVALRPEPAWRLHLAVATRQTGDASGALDLLRDLGRDEPAYAPARHHLGEALLEAGDLEGAETVFRETIAISPVLPYGYVGLGDALLQRGRVEDAVQVLEHALRIEEGYQRAHYLLGSAYLRLGREAEGERERLRGLGATPVRQPDELQPTISAYTVNLSGRIDLAGAYLDNGSPTEAIRLLEETARHYPSSVALLNTLASGYLRTRRLDDAERVLKRALALDERTFTTPLNLYTWALYAGRPDEALQFAETAVARGPDQDNTHLARAQALVELGRLEEALRSADRARELAPGIAQNHGLSGDINLKLSRYEQARTHFERAAELQPNLFPVWIGLAQARWNLGLKAEARQALAEAHRLAPNNRLANELAARYVQ
ncbi:MAG: tetratricopeptide repeat protein, partial [Rhodothermales bacterium]|nr:tetratricopeptide repeat protein [Rhodothermales bacterium]